MDYEDENDVSDLDSLLQEYDSVVPRLEPQEDDMAALEREAESLPDDAEGVLQEQEAPLPADSRVDDLVEWAKGIHLERLQEQIDREVSGIVQDVKSKIADLPVKPSDKMVRSFLENEYRTDERMQMAFDNRHTDPHGWANALKRATRSLRSELEGMPDQGLTDDRDVVAAAVLAAKTNRPRPEHGFSEHDVRKMSAKDLVATFPELGGY